jgi:dipeptidyl aminopeptidase/acylaminoacyl peptidase
MPFVSMMVAALSFLGSFLYAEEMPPRLLQPEDITLLRHVEDPNLSPDGKHVVYVVRESDLKLDKNVANIWMARFDGSENRALTFSDKSVTHPRFSLDGKWVGFLSSRDDENDVDQFWILPINGGEAEKVTTLKGGIEDFAWAPDSRRVVVVAKDPDGKSPDLKSTETKTPQPIVIDRFRFKRDGEGYLTQRYSHLELVEILGRKTVPLTSGNHDELLPAWSPDGKQIAFVTKRGDDPDRSENWNIYLIDAEAGAKEQPLTTCSGSCGHPEWETAPAFSPDGRFIAYLQGGDPKKIAYATRSLAVIRVDGREARVVTQKLHRNLSFLHWSSDAKSVFAVVEDDGDQYLAEIRIKDGDVATMTPKAYHITDFDLGLGGNLAVRMSTPEQPDEIYAFKKGEFFDLTKQNTSFRKKFKFGTTQRTQFKSKDGTEIHGFIMVPPNGAPGPSKSLLFLHGGPQLQYDGDFEVNMQVLAAAGYVVIMPNPRGSSGRGTDFAMKIFADWGHLDVEDDLAAVDDAVKKGLADPKRLAVGGWSYGGISTNYLIASTNRFKAAASGASISNILAGYGTDQYTYDYETELGVPWKDPETWMHLSYPFLHADRIKTPTLFMCGESDSNVPLINSEQMYEALRSLNVPAQLIIYPGQYHGISKPSYQIDRLKRYVDWYEKWVK